MTIDNKLFDDLTRMAGGAANIMTGIGKQISAGLKDQLKDQMSGKFAGFPFAPFAGFGAGVGGAGVDGGEDKSSGGSGARDENIPNDFNRLLAMLSHYRLEQEAIKQRLSVIEKALGIEAAPKTAGKSAGKTSGKAGGKAAGKPTGKVAGKGAGKTASKSSAPAATLAKSAKPTAKKSAAAKA